MTNDLAGQAWQGGDGQLQKEDPQPADEKLRQQFSPGPRVVLLQGAELRIRDARPEEIDAAGAVVGAAYQQFETVYPGESWERYITMVGDLRPRTGPSTLTARSRARASGRRAGAAWSVSPCCRRREAWASAGP